MSSKLYTFRSILQEGLQIDNSILKIATITIPRLQRAYAQGRKSESELRNLFLSDIFDSLENGTELEMNFIYGSAPIDISDNERDFELLDGQQRLTTLFLLYWYVANAELDELPDYLKRFEYRTRTTSTDFIKELSARKIVIQNSPSETIHNLKWFSYAFTNDATINAMLTMLDAIDVKYRELGENNLFERLENLKFYVLPLEGYGLSEELYIKMNARGLPLTPFENFKSDLIKYMKSEDRYQTDTTIGSIQKHKLQYYLAFASKIDTKWIDLFWNKEGISSKEYNQRYFRFFYRYFFIKYVLEASKTKSGEEFRKDTTAAFFDDISEKMQDERYLHFTHYKEVIASNPNKDYFRSIEAVLDVLHLYYNDVIYPSIQYPFELGNNWDFYSDSKTYRRINAIVFAAVIEYIEALSETTDNVCDAFDVINFKRWMRIVWNTVENTNIDGIVPEIYLIGRLSEIAHLDGATSDIYQTLAKRGTSGVLNRAVNEEIEKATEIVKHPEEEWESAFVEAEKHDFLRGMVGFFFTPDAGIEAFKHRFAMMSSMFDTEEKVIAQAYRKKSLLLRAMLAQLNSWYGGLRDLTFTQRIERKEFVLKNILASKPAIKEMFCRVLDNDESEIIAALEQEALPKPIDDNRLNEGETNLLQQAYDRLCTDSQIHKWMFGEEGARNKHFRIQWLYGHIFAAVPYTTKLRVMLDTQRDEMTMKLIQEHGFSICDDSQRETFEKYNFNKGYEVELEKEINNYVVNITFGLSHTYKIYIFIEDVEERQIKFDYFKSCGIEEAEYSGDYIWLYQGQYNTIDSSYSTIESDLKDLEHLLNQ